MAYDTIVIENNPVNILESFHQELNQDEFNIQSVITRDMGGFWSAKFNILNPRKNYALQMLANGPGRSVKIFNERSLPVWEGFISKVVVNTGAASAFNDVQPVANDVWVRYRDFTTGNLSRSAHATHANSQNKYGQKDWVLSGGQLRSAVADQKADNFLDFNFWATPQLDTFEVGGGGAGEIDLQIQCLGWWHTLDWRVYNQTILVVEANAAAVVEDIVGTFTTLSNALKNNLVGWWTLDEFSAGVGPVVREDSQGANDLTDNGTTPSATGKVSLATQHTNAVPDWMSHVSNADLQTGDIDFTVACWVYLDNKATTQTIVSKDNSVPGGDREYQIHYHQPTDRFRMQVFTAVDVAVTVVANTLGAPAAATWYFIIGWHDATANTLNIEVNDGGVDSIGTGGALQAAGAAEFRIGSNASGGGVNELDGRVDEVGFWKRVLTGSEGTGLYNGDNGAGYSDIGKTTRSGGVGEFINSTDIGANATQVAQEYDADRRAGGIIKSIADLGDVNGNVWIAGVGLDREFYFKPGAPPTETT